MPAHLARLPCPAAGPPHFATPNLDSNTGFQSPYFSLPSPHYHFPRRTILNKFTSLIHSPPSDLD